MKWYYTKQDNFKSLECTSKNTNKHCARLSANSNFSKIKNFENEYGLDLRYISVRYNYLPKLDEIKNKLLSLQSEYDNSKEINSFYINGVRTWLDKATRVGLVNLLNTKKENGDETCTIWFDNHSIELSIEKGLKLLANIELYSSECYNVTHSHLDKINNLTTLEEALAFDITADYPSILNIEIE